MSKWALGQFASRSDLTFKTALTADLVTALHNAAPLPLFPRNDLAGRIVVAMQRNGYWIARHPDCFNIVYIEGMDPDGTPTDNRNNVFNDLRIVFNVQASVVPKIVGLWEGTTEPSRKWTLEPMNPDGAFHIKFGQYKAWVTASTIPTRRSSRRERSRATAIRTRRSAGTSTSPSTERASASISTGDTISRTTTWAIRAPAASSAARPKGTANS
ncbi:hypothetical protein ACU8LZ_25655 (plasmid) [Rhizobium leguminosarum]